MPEQGTQLSSATRPQALVERAHVRDAEAIHRIVNFWAAKGDMLPRTMGEVYENLRDFFVVREDGETVAFSAGGAGYSCVAELRMIETIVSGAPKTPFLRFGDTVRIEMKDRTGHSIFGAIEQKVEKYER